MEKHAPPDEGNEDAASGTRIHAVLAYEADVSTLNATEEETLEMCLRDNKQVIADWVGYDGHAVPDKCMLETRLGLTPEGTVEIATKEGKYIFTGQADAILIKGSRALVIDYKTGRNETTKAIDNPQLAALAVLVWMFSNQRVTSIRVAIIQPWAGKPSICDYGENALKLAKSWLIETLRAAAASTPDDARTGDHCHYCRAKVACQAYKTAALNQIEIVQPMTIAGMDDETQRKALFARAMELPAPSLAGAVKGLSMVKRYVAAIEGAARMRAADDAEFQRHYTLREKRGRRTITDVQKVFVQCSKHGVTAEQFTAACSVPMGDIKDLLRAATGEKGKNLDALTDAVLEGAVEFGKPTFELTEVEV